MARKLSTPKRGKTTSSVKALGRKTAKPAKARGRDIVRPEAETPAHLDPVVVRILEEIGSHARHFERIAKRKRDGSEGNSSPKRQREMHAREALTLAGELTAHIAGWAVTHSIQTETSPRAAMAGLLEAGLSAAAPELATSFAEALRQIDGGEQPQLLSPPRKPGKRAPKTTLAVREAKLGAMAFVVFMTSKRSMRYDDAVAEVMRSFKVDQRTLLLWQGGLTRSCPGEFRRLLARAQKAGEESFALTYPKRRLSRQETEILEKYDADYGLEKLKDLGRRYRATQTGR